MMRIHRSRLIDRDRACSARGAPAGSADMRVSLGRTQHRSALAPHTCGHQLEARHHTRENCHNLAVT